jgi:hypothetical protein
MKTLLFSFISLCCIAQAQVVPSSSKGIAENAGTKIWTVDGNRSPDGQFEVVNVTKPLINDAGNHYRGTHFEIRAKSGQVIASEYAIKDPAFTSDHPPGDDVNDGAEKVLWRPDGRFVAISIQTSKFAIHTIVFFKDGEAFKQVQIPDYGDVDLKDPEAYDNTHVEPYHWRKNGDLVLDINFGYHTKYDGSIFEYFATVHFAGYPPKASKGPETKEIEKVIPPS